MEVRTAAPLDPGKYEALVNYDIPYQQSSYWNLARQECLPPESRASCVFYYQGNTGTATISARRYSKARASRVTAARRRQPSAAPTTPIPPLAAETAATPAPQPRTLLDWRIPPFPLLLAASPVNTGLSFNYPTASITLPLYQDLFFLYLVMACW